MYITLKSETFAVTDYLEWYKKLIKKKLNEMKKL